MNPQIWQGILQEARRLALSSEDKRRILREFLQTKILGYLFSQNKTEKLQFMGGTALRIVYGAPRFSEDLDFDNLGLKKGELKEMINQVSKNLEAEGIKNNVSWSSTGQRAVFVFENLLFELGISAHKAETLKINFDYQKKVGKIPHQVFFLSKFDIQQRIMVNTPEVILAEKIQALLFRKRVIPRDIFDIAWLLSKNFLPDEKVLRKSGLKIDEKLIEKMLSRSKEIRKDQLDRELTPFLFGPENLKLLTFFPDLVRKLR